MKALASRHVSDSNNFKKSFVIQVSYRFYMQSKGWLWNCSNKSMNLKIFTLNQFSSTLAVMVLLMSVYLTM
jgi:hypothetical protein